MRRYDILKVHNEPKAEAFMERLEGRKPVFLCAVATTETAKIPGISAAGKNTELADYTPPADIELLFYGRCRCIEGIPVTPEGIPTPALITMSALRLMGILPFALDCGLKVKPQTPVIDLGGKPGCDIRSGKTVENPGEILRRAELVGQAFAETADYLVVGESIPGGTTTALGVLTAMGVDAEGKVSSSMAQNPHSLKGRVVAEGMRAAGFRFGELRSDPLRAVSSLGDPTIPAISGLVLGATGKVPVLLAGGTQMGATLAVVKALKPERLGNLAVATTRWLVRDESSDLVGIVAQIADVPIVAADLNFTLSKHEGLKAYERGVVKEGVGAGGVAVAALLKAEGALDGRTQVAEIERNYERLVGG